MDQTFKTKIDAQPLITVLQRIVEAGRKRKEAGIDDTAVNYARLANDALLWLEADESGDLLTARSLIDKIHTRKI